MKKQNDTSELFNELGIIFRNGEEIKDYVFALVGVWSESLNYDYYTTEYFIAESCDTTDWDPKVISDKRNAFVENQLQDLSEEIQNLKSTLERYHINTNPRNINNAIQTIWKEDHSYFENLKNWKENRGLNNLSQILDKSRTANLEELIYYLSFIYLDLLRVREFLLSKFEKTTSSRNDIQTTSQPLKITEIKTSSKKPKENINNFGFSKESNLPLLLFNTFSDNEILDDLVNKTDFINVLTNDWDSSNVKLKIKNTTLLAVLVSELKNSEISSFFKNFNFANIGKSQKFFTEDTAFITQNNLSSSKRSVRFNYKLSEYQKTSRSIISSISGSLLPK